MNLSRVLEALLFAADAPLTVEQIAVSIPEATLEEIEAGLEAIQASAEQEERGWQLVRLAGGWQLLSHADLYPYVERLLEGKRRARLSRAALESLAVVAYRQPITRGELEDLRGVDCGAVIHTLLERDLVTIAGRSSAIGRPLLYRTTERFLEHFGLASLQELPRLEEVEALWASDEVRTQLEFELARRIGDVPGGPPAAGNGDGHSDGNGNGHSDGHRHASDPAGEGDAGGSDGSNGAAGEADLVLALVEGNGHSDAHSDAHSGAHADGGGNGGGNGGGDGERGGDLARRLTVLANPEGSDFSPDEG